MRRGREKRAHANQGEGARILDEMSRQMPQYVAEKKTETRADKEGGCENASDSAGTESGAGREHLENQDDRKGLPDPLAAQDCVDRAVTIPANFGMKDRERANDQSADAHLDIDRGVNARGQVFARAQEPDVPWAQSGRRQFRGKDRE